MFNMLMGYAAMVLLGLMPLAAVARLTGVEGQRAFFLPTELALVVAFLLGLALCLLLGRGLGLLEFRGLSAYEEHIERFGDSRASQRRRERQRAADERRQSGRQRERRLRERA